jgi:hypothetical protein
VFFGIIALSAGPVLVQQLEELGQSLGSRRPKPKPIRAAFSTRSTGRN